MKYFLLAVILLLPACRNPQVVLAQDRITRYSDAGSNGQMLVAKHDLEVHRAEITLIASSWPEEKAKAVGSDVMLMLLDDQFSTLAWGLLKREDVPQKKGLWAGVNFNRKIKLKADQVFVLRVIEISRGGKYGWNNYGYAEGNPYLGGGIINKFTVKDDIDLAFRLFDRPK